MDPLAIAFIAGGVGFALLLGLGLWIAARRAKRHEEAARRAEWVSAPIAGPILNRRALLWAGAMFVFAVAMGGLTKKGGPIPQSSVWAGVLVGVVIVGGTAGFVHAAARRVGEVQLDRKANTLTLVVGGWTRTFLLNEPFEYGEFSLLPGGLYTNGGTVVFLRQGSTSGSFWYVNSLKDLKGKQPEPIGGPPEYLRTNELGKVIREHLRAVVADASA